MPPRPPELRPYRVAVYVAFGVVCAIFFLQLFRSVLGDLYGRSALTLAPAAAPPTPTSCLEDLDRLFAQLAARAVQPAPGGLQQGALSREFDTWARRWEAEVESVQQRCKLGESQQPAMRELAEALDELEELRRVLSQSGEEVTRSASKVRISLDTAREFLRPR